MSPLSRILREQNKYIQENGMSAFDSARRIFEACENPAR